MGKDGSRPLFVGRSIAKEQRFDEQAAALYGEIKIADEALGEVERILANASLEELRSYPRYQPAGQREIYVFTTDYQPALSGFLSIIFEITHSVDTVVLHSVKRFVKQPLRPEPEPEPEQGPETEAE